MGYLRRPLLEARLTEQKKQQLALDPEGPEPTLLEPKCRLFVEGTEVNFNEHLFVQALIHSGLVEEQIDVRTIWGEDDEGRKFILGWCAFTWQVRLTRVCRAVTAPSPACKALV